MNVNFTEEELAFRDEVKQFFAEKYPEDIRRKRDEGIPLSPQDTIRWQKILFEQGWFAARQFDCNREFVLVQRDQAIGRQQVQR